MLISKPWGSEEILECNDAYMLKRLFMKKGCRCSYQYHRDKVETVYVLEGMLELQLEDTFITISPGQFYTIMPMEQHRMKGLEDTFYLEASTPHKDDVVRIEDDYARV